MDSTKAFTTARKTQPHPRKETASGLIPHTARMFKQTPLKFLNLIKKHFPPNHNLHSVFNKNNVKVSYSCMPNMGSIIKNHNKKILNNNSTSQNRCNCRKKDQCPLDNNCLITSVIYKANVTTDKDNTGKNYIGLTEGTFKQRYTQHNLTFRKRKYASRTELEKHIWKLKDNEENYKISWSIISSASTYNNISKRCTLRLTEKLHIIKADKARNLNKRTKLISKCRHENKYFLANIDLRLQ